MFAKVFDNDELGQILAFKDLDDEANFAIKIVIQTDLSHTSSIDVGYQSLAERDQAFEDFEDSSAEFWAKKITKVIISKSMYET